MTSDTDGNLSNYVFEVREISSAYFNIPAHSEKEAFMLFDTFVNSDEGTYDVNQLLERGYEGWELTYLGQSDKNADYDYEYLKELAVYKNESF